MVARDKHAQKVIPTQSSTHESNFLAHNQQARVHDIGICLVGIHYFKVIYFCIKYQCELFDDESSQYRLQGLKCVGDKKVEIDFLRV